MSYLGRGNRQRSFGRPSRDTEPPHMPSLPPKQRLSPTPPVEPKKLWFPLMKKDLLVPQMTLREIAWTILDWQTQLDDRELNVEVNRMWDTQRLTPLEKDYVMSLLPKLRDEEIRNQIHYGDI